MFKVDDIITTEGQTQTLFSKGRERLTFKYSLNSIE